MRQVHLALLLTLAAVTAFGAAARINRLKEGVAPGHHLLYLPSGNYLKLVTFGYGNLAADLIYIWSIQYYSNYQIADRYDYLDQIYRRIIAELDPHYVDPYLVGSMIMSIEAGRDDLALRLLDEGIARNPGEWILPFEAGWLCFTRLRDYERARSYFEKAVAVPGAPAVAKRLYAEMFNRAGDKRTSLKYWSEIYRTADSDYVRKVGWMHVHDLSIDLGVEDLARAIEAYRQRSGRLPVGLGALVREGVLPSLPVDPEGRGYLYDARTGRVWSQSRRLLGNP